MAVSVIKMNKSWQNSELKSRHCCTASPSPRNVGDATITAATVEETTLTAPNAPTSDLLAKEYFAVDEPKDKSKGYETQPSR
jgi:hypothetical protein